MSARNTRTALATLALAVASGTANAQSPESGVAEGQPRPVIDYSSCSKPAWPAGAQEANRTGSVTLLFLIGQDGKVKQSRIVKSSGHTDLDDAAHTSLARCRFKPGTVDGKPAEAWMPVQYIWK
jgi:TonB family protein